MNDFDEASEQVVPMTGDEKVDALLKADPELRSRLSSIEAALVAHFGPRAEVERTVSVYYDSPDASDELYLRVCADLSIDETIDRLEEFLRREKELLAPVFERLTIGFL